VVIHDLYFVSVSVRPEEANAPLVIDPNAPLPFAVPFEGLKPIAWRIFQVFHRKGSIQLAKLA